MIAEQEKLDAIAPVRQQPRRDESVAAIAARTAKHNDAAATPCAADRLFGHRRPRPLHQNDAGDPARDRQPIGLAHLGRGQQFRAF